LVDDLRASRSGNRAGAAGRAHGAVCLVAAATVPPPLLAAPV